ncbi:MAG TPA: hypothetical protein VMH20_20070 [Verrucomicrobiae bacterium]|nr:hypothetical protein [Verrucomicrobiae bacterium]
MKRVFVVFLAWLLLATTIILCQELPKSSENSGFVLGVNTYFDFGPPNNYYEIFIVAPTTAGSKVEKFTLTPLARKCTAPEKTEYVEKISTLSVKELLAGVDPCNVSEKALKKERRRKTKELNFSGANVAMQVTCGGTTKTMEMRVLERDWFLAHPDTPRNTSWTLELLSKLRDLTGPSVMDKPMLAVAERGPRAPLSADPVSLENLNTGKYDALFPDAIEKASEIYHASLIQLPQSTVTLVSSTPVDPVQFTLPPFPLLPSWLRRTASPP